MKILNTLFLIILSIFCYAQSNNDDLYGKKTDEKYSSLINNIPIVDDEIFYEVVKNVEGQSKNDLYKKAKLAFVELFKDSKSVIQLDDREGGEIIGKGISYFYFKNLMMDVRNTMEFTMSITVKDNKYRIQIYDISTSSGTQEYSFDILNFPKYYGDNMKAKIVSSFIQNVDSLFLQINMLMTKKKSSDF
jgi:hypothetical protein